MNGCIIIQSATILQSVFVSRPLLWEVSLYWAPLQREAVWWPARLLAVDPGSAVHKLCDHIQPLYPLGAL